MKFIRMHKEWGWEMWGLLGKNGRWFFGFSRVAIDRARGDMK